MRMRLPAIKQFIASGKGRQDLSCAETLCAEPLCDHKHDTLLCEAAGPECELRTVTILCTTAQSRQCHHRTTAACACKCCKYGVQSCCKCEFVPRGQKLCTNDMRVERINSRVVPRYLRPMTKGSGSNLREMMRAPGTRIQMIS